MHLAPIPYYDILYPNNPWMVLLKACISFLILPQNTKDSMCRNVSNVFPYNESQRLLYEKKQSVFKISFFVCFT